MTPKAAADPILPMMDRTNVRLRNSVAIKEISLKELVKNIYQEKL
jgi:hypothetical protein